MANARLCFSQSLAFCSDELKRREKVSMADYVDFLEAIARLATLMQLPDAEMLKRYRCNTVDAFFDRVHAGEIDGAAIMLPRGTWLQEELSEETLAPQLEILLQLLEQRTDDDAVKAARESGRPRANRSDLAQMRRRTVQQRMPLLEKHEALPEPAALLEAEEMKMQFSKMRPRRASLTGIL